MLPGAGKYDEQCTRALLETQAGACLLIVIGGVHGDGLSITINTSNFAPQVALPALLRHVANQIEQGYS